MLESGTVLDIGDHSGEVLGDPSALEERHLLRVEATGVAGALVPAIAAVGRLVGYRPHTLAEEPVERP
jgi:hypothetical protein